MGNLWPAVFELLAATVKAEGFQSAATIAVNELAKRLNCDRVGVGFRGNGPVVVAALSGRATLDRRMNMVHALGEAMDECLDQRLTLLFPPAGSLASHTITRAHEELARLFGSAFVLTVPFVDKQGALIFVRANGQPFDTAEIAFSETVASILGPILGEKHRAARPFFQKAFAVLQDLVRNLIGPRYPGRRLAAVCLAPLVIFFIFATAEYRVPAASLLEGSIQRAVIAPFDGYLDQVFYRAGDVVRQGEVLAAMDTRDFLLERVKLASLKRQHTLEYHKAMAENMTAAGKIVQEQIQQAESQLSLLEEQISRARVRAPFAGLIISGDWSQAVGTSVSRGRVLFEIAPLDSYRVRLEVNEKDIAQVAEGQGGELVLHALPGTPFHFTVHRITPVSVSRAGRNFFVVEAELREKSERLRPGMKGYGKIITQRRKLVWIWTHELVDWLRLRLWAMVP